MESHGLVGSPTKAILAIGASRSGPKSSFQFFNSLQLDQILPFQALQFGLHSLDLLQRLIYNPSMHHGNKDFQNLSEREIIHGLLEPLKPYFKIIPFIFYLDLLATGIVAWLSLLLIQTEIVPWWMKVVFLIVSYTAFYRGLSFIHEVVHFRKRVKGLRLLYNLIFGFPQRIPFFVHDPHRYHHLPSTFGTPDDPEYTYLKGSGFKTFLKPLAVGLLSPFVLAIRFGIVPLISWAFPKKWQITLYRKASTIVVNPSYIRTNPSSEELQASLFEERMCAVFFVLQLLLIKAGLIQYPVILAWLSLMMTGSFVNVWRARIAHRYDNPPGQKLSPLAQLRDSVTVEKRFLSFLWAPLGLQYHSLHHLAPQIPYYYLKSAHEVLKKRIDGAHPYSQTVLTSVPKGLKVFYNTVINQNRF